MVLEGQRYLLAAARDVSARLAAERQRHRHQAELEALNATLEERVRTAVAELRTRDQLLIGQSRQAAMGEMIGNIAHQWRQPLNALGLVLANLRDAARFDELDRATAERAVADANRLIQGMSTTINVFRDFFRPEKQPGAFSARAEVEDTIALVGAVFAGCRHRARGRARRRPGAVRGRQRVRPGPAQPVDQRPPGDPGRRARRRAA